MSNVYLAGLRNISKEFLDTGCAFCKSLAEQASLYICSAEDRIIAEACNTSFEYDKNRRIAEWHGFIEVTENGTAEYLIVQAVNSNMCMTYKVVSSLDYAEEFDPTLGYKFRVMYRDMLAGDIISVQSLCIQAPVAFIPACTL